MLIASNWRWIQLDQWCSRGASASGAPITVAIAIDGYGLANASTNSQRITRAGPPPLPCAPAEAAIACSSSSSRNSRITGR